jgi:tagatose-1,6-bisphosphate aldolase
MTRTLDALARETGTFLMVAMDQRESLRAMLAQHHPEPIDDTRMRRFKLAVARELAPHASGFLIDRHYAYDELLAQRLVPASCGLILAADALAQPRGGAVEETDLDGGLDAAAAAEAGVAALKLLVVWRDDERRELRVRTARRFVSLAHEHGLLSVLEGVVRARRGRPRARRCRARPLQVRGAASRARGAGGDRGARTGDRRRSGVPVGRPVAGCRAGRLSCRRRGGVSRRRVGDAGGARALDERARGRRPG